MCMLVELTMRWYSLFNLFFYRVENICCHYVNSVEKILLKSIDVITVQFKWLRLLSLLNVNLNATIYIRSCSAQIHENFLLLFFDDFYPESVYVVLGTTRVRALD